MLEVDESPRQHIDMHNMKMSFLYNQNQIMRNRTRLMLCSVMITFVIILSLAVVASWHTIGNHNKNADEIRTENIQLGNRDEIQNHVQVENDGEFNDNIEVEHQEEHHDVCGCTRPDLNVRTKVLSIEIPHDMQVAAAR